MSQNCNRYPAKFVALIDSESIESTKRNYFTWIISVTVLFGVTVGFLCHKLFIGSNYFNNTLPQSDKVNDDSLITRTSRFPMLKVFRPEITSGKNAGKEHPEFSCEQTKPQLETVPLALRKKILLKEFYSEDIYDYINADLILYYERIINKHNPKYLKSVFNGYRLELSAVSNSADFVSFLRGLTSNKFKFYSDFLKEQKFQLKLNEFDWLFTITEEMSQWYNYLDRLESFLSHYEQQNRRKSFGNITNSNFAKFTEETHNELFHFAYPFSVTEKKLVELNEILSKWTKPLQMDRSNCTLMFFNAAVLLSEVSAELRKLNASGFQNVYIYASRILYLDTHLELLGVNLAFIAPRWEFVKKIIINISGILGQDHPHDTASAEQPGKPGNPGGSGGDFLGVGSFQEKFLLISANGGEGGRGQNGAKGRDGLNNTHPRPPFDKPSCVVQVKTFKDLFPSKITHYEIYNEEGCGGPGTDGGVGGKGGYGGLITLISKNSKKIVRGLNGVSGLPGKGGTGGIGGRNGCFYEAIDENDEFLHPITTVKCPSGNMLPTGRSGKDNYNSRGQVFPRAKENLSVHRCIYRYIQLAREHFVKYNDPHVLSFLQELNNYGETQLEDILRDFESVDKFDRIEYYQLFKEKLSEGFRVAENSTKFLLNYLESIVLGEMLYLKNNINYFFIDMKNYLNIVKRSLENLNENIQEFQAISYFKKKVRIKFEQLNQNLRLLNEKLSAAEVLLKNGTEYSVEKSIYCVMLITIDVVTLLMNRSCELTNPGLYNSLSLCSVSTGPNPKSQSKLPENYNISALEDIANAERILLRLLPPFVESEAEIRRCLIDLKDSLNVLEESNVIHEEQKTLLQALNDEVEHFVALFYFVEWERSEKFFSESLNKLKASSSGIASSEFLKARLLDVVVALQLKLGDDVSRQQFYPLLKANTLLPLKKKALSDIFTQINIERDLNDRSPFCKNHIKAIFDKNSTVGEFFSWTNTEIKNKLKVLFSGEEINLKSNLINRHVLDKSYLQFNSLKLDFDCLDKENICADFREILSNFKVDIIHSGYSYYNWEDETHFVVSERVTLSYSLKAWNNQEPELYNAFFKKCQDGEIKLSPFTTWTVRLLPMNENANFSNLATFADVVNLNLIGTGTYTI